MNIRDEFKKFDFAKYNTNIAPSWAIIFANCPGQYDYGKVQRKKPIRRTLSNGSIDGSILHAVLARYGKKVEYRAIIPINWSYDYSVVQKNIVKVINHIFPKEKREYYNNRFNKDIFNFSVYEVMRLKYIQNSVGISKKTFDRYYKPLACELSQTKDLKKRGITYKLDLLYLLPPDYGDLGNEFEEYCVGDYKSGRIPYNIGVGLNENLKIQLIFPIPFLPVPIIPRYIVGIYIKELKITELENKKKFYEPYAIYEEVTPSDLHQLKNLLKLMEKSLEKKEFIKTFNGCSHCDYKTYCVQDIPIEKRFLKHKPKRFFRWFW